MTVQLVDRYDVGMKRDKIVAQISWPVRDASLLVEIGRQPELHGAFYRLIFGNNGIDISVIQPIRLDNWTHYVLNTH